MSRPLLATCLVSLLAWAAPAWALEAPKIDGGSCGDTRARLWWSGGGSDHTGYNVYRRSRADSSQPWGPQVHVGSIQRPTRANTFRDSGITSGHEYRYIVSATAGALESSRSQFFTCFVRQTTWDLSPTNPPTSIPPQGDAVAAGEITHVPENRPDNAAANDYVPSDAELSAFHSAAAAGFNTNAQFVTGRPGLANPSTDDLIQWAAHKWGIPEDWIRAQMVLETLWHQNFLGDRTTVPENECVQYPSQSQVWQNGHCVAAYQSLGISQIRWEPVNPDQPGTEPLRWKSTAFALDYYGATVRYYFNGLCNWGCSAGYGSDQRWPSIGSWNTPSPWNNATAQDYVSQVKSILSNRDWTDPGF